MKHALFATVGLAFCLNAAASCVGTSAFQTCTDSTGNTYNVQRFGNTTTMNGYNSNGSTWSQTSNTLGNTTFHNGTAANGQAWSGSTTNIGNTQFHNGINSRGQSYQRTCTNGWCN